MKTTPAQKTQQESPPLLVQCCHLPQFFYIAEKLRQKEDRSYDALVIDHPHVEFYLDRFPYFRKVFLFRKSLPDFDLEHADVIFPLLNRGYLKIKRVARKIRTRRWECDYDGNLQAVTANRILASSLRIRHFPTSNFVDYMKSFPPRPFGKKILVLESCHSDLSAETTELRHRMIPPEADVRHLSALSLPLWRELRKEDFDAAIVYFSGEPGFFKLKVLPFLLGIRDVLVINEHSNHFLADPRTLAKFFFQRLAHGSFQPVQKKLVLWIQTEIPEYTALAVKKLVKQDLLPDCEIALFCREEDRPQLQNLPQVAQVISFSRGNRRHNFRSWQKLRKLYPDVVASLFSGRPIFRKQKLLFFLFFDHPQLVFNAGLDCYWLKPWTLPRLLRHDALLLEDPKAEGPKVLMVQTESERYVREAIRRVTGDRLYPNAKVAVLCREADRSAFERLPGVSHVFTFDRAKHKGLLKTLGKVRRFSPEIISAVFSGRNVFWKQKLLFLLYFRKPRLTFNAQLDAYWMSLRTFARIFRQEPLLFEDTSHRAEVLLIQTESDSVTWQAMEAMVSGKAVAGDRLAIFCSEDKQPFFEQFSAIERFYTYKPGQILSNLGSLKQLLRRDRDVVSAVFTGRPVYRMQKLLFFLLPARNQLVFNENLDCFYLRRGRWSRSLGLPSFLRLLHVHQQSVPAAGPSLHRQILKTVLFFPRFLYLLTWTAVMKMKRSYRLGKVASD